MYEMMFHIPNRAQQKAAKGLMHKMSARILLLDSKASCKLNINRLFLTLQRIVVWKNTKYRTCNVRYFNLTFHSTFGFRVTYLSFIPNFKSVFNRNKIRGDQTKGKTVNFNSALSPFFDNFQTKGFPFEINLNQIEFKKKKKACSAMITSEGSLSHRITSFLFGSLDLSTTKGSVNKV